jgi:hypothetical protein
MNTNKLKIKDLRVKSFVTTPAVKVKTKIQRNDGGYTWVG